MKWNPEIASFFSDQKRLEKIDQLHTLLFNCLSMTEEWLQSEINKAVGELADTYSPRWGRVNDATHCGFVLPQDAARAAIWVHVGWNTQFLSQAWVGIHLTPSNDVNLRHRLIEITRTLFDNPHFDESNESDPYVIYEYVPEWPAINSTRRLSRDDKIAGLAQVLRDGNKGGQEIVSGIKTKLTKILDRLDQLREEYQRDRA
jgi:hypothetical protein